MKKQYKKKDGTSDIGEVGFPVFRGEVDFK